MIFIKVKNLFATSSILVNKNSVTSLVKSIIWEQYISDRKKIKDLNNKLIYLSKYRYSPYLNVSQGENILLSNLLVHNSINTIQETPHIIYHTLEQKSRLQIIPDEEIFNMKNNKYGDFEDVEKNLWIEAKTWKFLLQENLDDLVNQYKENKRNKNFKFSLFYSESGNINERAAKEYLWNELKLEENQVILKSFDAISESFTDKNIDTTINYYNISWVLYQTENNQRLLSIIEELIDSGNYSHDQYKEVNRYKKLLTAVENNGFMTKKQKMKIPYKNNQLLLEDKTQIIEEELTPEMIMEDQQVIDFNYDPNKEK